MEEEEGFHAHSKTDVIGVICLLHRIEGGLRKDMDPVTFYESIICATYVRCIQGAVHIQTARSSSSPLPRFLGIVRTLLAMLKSL